MIDGAVCRHGKLPTKLQLFHLICCIYIYVGQIIALAFDTSNGNILSSNGFVYSLHVRYSSCASADPSRMESTRFILSIHAAGPLQ